MMKLKFIVGILFLAIFTVKVYATDSKLGVHILETEELSQVSNLLPDGGFITVPIRLE